MKPKHLLALAAPALVALVAPEIRSSIAHLVSSVPGEYWAGIVLALGALFIIKRKG
jgi:hypothetical protein